MKDPFAFQGTRRRGYFEGWYCKNVTSGGRAFAFIPGVSYDQQGNGHAFVQVIRGSDGATEYQRYPLEQFHPETRTFSVRVGPNRFGYDGIQLDLPGIFGGIAGNLRYRDLRRPPRTLIRPGLMGWYRYVPFMECYHDVGSVDHRISGTLDVGGETLDFDNGDGYLEKDWGTSMPQSWIWLQCNGSPDGVSFMVSIARVPWLGGAFEGFLGYVAPPNGPIITFGTYSGARVESVSTEALSIDLRIALKGTVLVVHGERRTVGTLAAPAAGAMDRRISESLDGTIHLRMTGQEEELLWSSTCSAAGIEVVGR
jgi:hypothetical protein